MILICSILGLPWFVAATVRAITHVRSLMVESEVSIPGERPQMIGVRLVWIFQYALVWAAREILGTEPVSILEKEYHEIFDNIFSSFLSIYI